MWILADLSYTSQYLSLLREIKSIEYSRTMESWSEEDEYQWVAQEFDEATAKDFEGWPSHYTLAK